MQADCFSSSSLTHGLSAAGVLLNPITPEWLQTALLTVLLLVVVRKTFQKGFRQWHEEQKGAARRAATRPCCARLYCTLSEARGVRRTCQRAVCQACGA